MQKPAITQAPIHDIIGHRWSPRAYDANKPVSQAQIMSLLEAARWAPSCFGDEPWRLLLWDKYQDATTWEQALECIAPGNQTWAKSAPVLILACANTLLSHNQQTNRWGAYDTGAAVMNLCLQATSMGLATHQMGGFDGEQARAAFNIPAQFELMSMLAIGYRAQTDALTDELRTRELAPRRRSALGQLFYQGVWNQPII